MLSFKEMLDDDINNVFLNIDEFGSKHNIEGEEITCIFDDEALRQRQSGAEIGVSESSLLIFARTNDLPFRKGVDEHLCVDHKEYTIDAWDENMGMTQIALSQVRTA